jgi:hypothetical protein
MIKRCSFKSLRSIKGWPRDNSLLSQLKSFQISYWSWFQGDLGAKGSLGCSKLDYDLVLLVSSSKFILRVRGNGTNQVCHRVHKKLKAKEFEVTHGAWHGVWSASRQAQKGIASHIKA